MDEVEDTDYNMDGQENINSNMDGQVKIDSDMDAQEEILLEFEVEDQKTLQNEEEEDIMVVDTSLEKGVDFPPSGPPEMSSPILLKIKKDYLHIEILTTILPIWMG